MLNQYFKDIYKTYKTGDATEASYYPDLKKLLENFLKSKGISPNITVQSKKTKAGIPDFTIRKGKELIGYVEAKDLTIENLEKVEDSDQIKRYKEKLPNFILTNYFDFWLWRRDAIDEKKGRWVKKVRIGQPVTFKLNQPSPAQKEKEFFELLEAFFSYYLPERKTAKALAVELASRAQLLPSYIIEELNNDVETEIDRIYSAFKRFLISDLKKEDFADIYAQTITYGLFAARLRYQGKDFNRFLAQELIPKNIKILYDTFNLISHDRLTESLAWIIDDMATVLAHADMKKIKKELHLKKGGDDPLIHFYETFLAEYDPKKRKTRGVYYTPLPVVSYITRSINILLKEKFSKKMGFASEGVTLLDPASGTLTFPASAIMLAKEEIEKSQIAGSWLQVVKNHILKNYYAFELLMAPYIIGHLKISLLLEDLGYWLENGERFQLYLTNTLDMSEVKQSQLPFVAGLSEEARKAKEVKDKIPIMVIMSNPPYSGQSENKGKWILKQIEEYKQIEGESLDERNPKWIQDDYVKFFRFAQWKIEQNEVGILGFITNHAWLDNPTFRGMRYSLLKTFNEIYILNLHGSMLKKEKIFSGGKDENVFDIQPGVAITLGIKNNLSKERKVFYADLWGLRKEKYNWLENHDIKSTKWQELAPNDPYYFLVPKKEEGFELYKTFYKITDIFPVNSVGVVTARDEFVIDFNRQLLEARIRTFRDTIEDDEFVKQTYKLKDKPTFRWYVSRAREKMRDLKDWEKNFYKILYRPFDERWIYYHSSVIERTRENIMKHLLRPNLALSLTKRHPAEDLYNDVFISDKLTEGHLLSGALGITYTFPLFLYNNIEKQTDLFSKDDKSKGNKIPNINNNLFTTLQNNFNQKIEPEEIFNYIYAILYSNIYRRNYNEFLKIDFPKVPFTSDEKLFHKIVEQGKELASLHLLKSQKLEKSVSRFPAAGDNVVRKREYNSKEKRIYINDKQYFDGVEQKVWNYYIGGYQVLDKWLKDRIGRTLSAEDVNHYLKIITALQKTIEIQKEIDKLYPEVEKKLKN